MRPVREWDEEYILGLPIGEFDWFEAKGRKALDLTLPNVKESEILQPISKALAAFANSGGGALVYGVANATSTTGQRFVDDGGVATKSPKGDVREWLENVLPHLVEFPLTTFNVYAILPKSSTSQIQPGRALYVIDIPDSAHAPHQANDYRYYIRAGGKSVPIGHRLVADIMGRRQHPQFEFSFKIEKEIKTDNGGLSYVPSFPLQGQTLHVRRVTEYTLVVTARNTGRVYAQYVNCFFQIPSMLEPKSEFEKELEAALAQSEEKEVEPFQEYYKDNTVRDVVETQFGVGGSINKRGPARFDPILPGLSHVWRIQLTNKFESTLLDGLVIKWSAHADNALANEGEVLVTAIPLIEVK